MPIISHIKEKDGKWEIQSNAEHCEGVARLAARFAGEFGYGEWGRVMGLLHDSGKERHAFQQHIMRESGYDPSVHVEGNYDHAYVGALLAKELFPKQSPLITNALMGHHRGLYDSGEWEYILKRNIPSDVSRQQISADLQIPRTDIKPKDIHHIIRMLFSCLVDADRLDTEAFMNPDQSVFRNTEYSLASLMPLLEVHLNQLKKNTKDTEVNRIRNYVQQKCLELSETPPGLFSLTVPTGGGKTLSSVLWAMRHAIRNQQRRIIIAIPYTSIIVQTAAVLKGIFGEENVLEHHSDFAFDDNGQSDDNLKCKLATENWDYPIIVTTNVQLFESLFSNRPSVCRKLHNIANSVLILDEVQTLPIDFLRPIIDTLGTLERLFKTSVLFTTASQPILSGKIVGCNPMAGFEALPEVCEIIPQNAGLHEKLRRVRLDIDDSPKDYDEIAAALCKFDKVLCIVNTRRDAKELYDRLPNEGICLHLSRMMCPSHVKETIQRIKEALTDERNQIIRVIATQLIEAGVDIDFPVVFRQQAGLDSILQAAGRCNREGKRGICTTYVFSLQKEHPLPRGFISQTNSARMNMGTDHDWFSQEAMSSYFIQLYSRISSFDKVQIAKLLYTSEQQFEEAAKVFKLIEDDSTGVIVNWKDSMELVKRLKRVGPSYTLMKKLSQYTVGVRKSDLQKLKESGSLEEVLQGVYVVSDKACYDANVGMITDNHWMEEILIK
ncbi:MAG: CRISPR-associated helicase Cas3' [Bacteroidales bacterium]|jgi:CRISPR-associated endonuclease/helicase Cas3|nr:CRISPR-associated helicase Cas3' [Bacteroidales bacterium]